MHRESAPANDFAGSISHGNQQADINNLRALILGADYKTLLDFQQCLRNRERYQQHIADIVAEAIELRNNHDGAVAQVLAPMVEQSLAASVRANPQPLADALYPVMGPAIRRSISETMNQALENFNRALEQSFSLQALTWRLDALRSGRTYAEIAMLKSLDFQVEQLFLIHRETSTLLHHVVNENTNVADADMVSGMLSAIQDFVADSFSVDTDDALNTLRLGDLTVSIETGPKAILAAVVRGSVPESLITRLQETLELVHHNHHSALSDFTGDPEPFTATDTHLRQCLLRKQKKQTETKQLWPIFAVACTAILAAVTVKWMDYQQNSTWTATLNALKEEPGFVITTSGRENNKYFIEGLRDPIARAPETVLAQQKLPTDKIEWRLKYFNSLDSGLAKQRLQAQVPPPAGVSYNLRANTLQLFGVTSHTALAKFESNALSISGIDNIDRRYLTVIEPEPIVAAAQQGDGVRSMETLARELNALVFYFAHGQAMPIQASRNQLVRVQPKLKQLNNLALAQNKKLTIRLQGYSDATGTQSANLKMSQQRADTIKELLDLDPSIVVESQGRGHIANKAINSPMYDRRVTVDVVLEHNTDS